MKCCGKVRSTPFCPQCGKKLKGSDPLESLLSYLLDMEKSQERALAALKEKAPEGEEPGEYLIQQMEKKEHSRQKWQTWADALAVKMGIVQDEKLDEDEPETEEDDE